MKRTGKIIFNTLIFLYSFSIVFGKPAHSIALLDRNNVENYLNPLSSMLNASIHSGYFSKASTHKVLGYDITFKIINAMLPANMYTYDYVIPDDSITYNFNFQLHYITIIF